MKETFLVNGNHQVVSINVQVLDVLLETSNGHILCASHEGRKLYATDEMEIRKALTEARHSLDPEQSLMANLVSVIIKGEKINKLELTRK